MKSAYKLILVLIALYFLPGTGNAQNATSTPYKCMVQMTNYVGEGAYIVVSLIDSKGKYEKTLRVMGADKKWYPSLKSWHEFRSKKPANIDAVTGASVTGGDRSVTVLEIDNAKINAGYKLRFETAVEDKKYYEKDLEIPLTTEGLAAKSEGTGYIRYVRLAQN
ncbi:DUF2271 domain-containing protein [Paraflavitalea soli]|uniref:DUF2271 domain-containing protein n=2 Tax=Paraflavitalea soli TaxID=2315862 RepID=A0A3B7MI68_9BACT|nr:DUF2271 domain-containing protein [Paraflavitalea soli]